MIETLFDDHKELLEPDNTSQSLLEDHNELNLYNANMAFLTLNTFEILGMVKNMRADYEDKHEEINKGIGSKCDAMMSQTE